MPLNLKLQRIIAESMQFHEKNINNNPLGYVERGQILENQTSNDCPRIVVMTYLFQEIP
jgi:hypothetical protein